MRSVSASPRSQELKEDLENWEDFAGDAEVIAGDCFPIVDCASWPLLNEIVTEWEEWSEREISGSCGLSPGGLPEGMCEEVCWRGLR